jgi:hypothetical protein
MLYFCRQLLATVSFAILPTLKQDLHTELRKKALAVCNKFLLRLASQFSSPCRRLADAISRGDALLFQMDRCAFSNRVDAIFR